MRALVLGFGLAAALWSLGITAAAAQTVQMRSGDHARFVRLVLAIPEAAAWKIGRIPGGYALDMQDPAVLFDTSGVFARIPRSRLAELDPGAGRLGMALACDCHLSAFLWRPDRLVIDLVDGPPPANARYETALDEVISPVLPRVATRPSFGLRTAGTAPVTVARAGPLRPAAPAGLPDPFSDAVQRQNRLVEAERAILDSLARAASQGLLDLPGFAPPVAPPAQDPSKPAAVTAAEAVAPSPPGAKMPEPGASPRPGLAVQTSVDRDRPAAAAAAAELNAAGASCIDSALLDVAAWGDGRDFQSHIGYRYAAVAGELDRPPAGSVEALARSYIHFGFGREALQALALDGAATHERRIMAALAQVVDQEEVTGDVFAGQQGCTTPVALWASLARGSVGGTSEPERLAIVGAYRALPDPLRGHLGNRLAQLFVEAGDTARAAALLNVAAPAVTGGDPAADLTRAEVSARTDGPQAALAQLDTMAKDDPRLTPEAALRLIDMSLEEGREVPAATLELAATLRFENRGSDMAAALGAAEARALTMAGRFDEALALLRTDLSPMSLEEVAALRSGVVGAASARLPDPGFLALAFADLPPGTDAAAGNAVAARLLAAGFAERAAAILATAAEGPDQAERRYLRAEAAVALDQPEVVEAALAGIASPRAARLRARSLAAQGDFAAALTAAAEAPEDGADPGAAWRAGAWQALGSQDGDALLRAASDAVLFPVAVPPDAPPLAERRALLAQAAATRALTVELLDRFAISPDAAPGAVSAATGAGPAPAATN